ncbi:MAG TPA: uroporphyrinogen-III synthase [Acidimicrobiales bacterium]|nr:uroporphyrinogen-III synthase [Acidimicrobiales bacterium]
MSTSDPPTDGQPLRGRRIGITADRRWQEQADLFRKRGAEVVHGPTMRTVDLTADDALRRATAALAADPPAVLVATTGFGMRRWLEAAAVWGVEADLLAALGRAHVVARGAKSSSAVRQAGLEVAWRAPHETMDEVLDHLGERGVEGARVALQLFDPDDHPATEALRAAVGTGGELVEVPLYRWVLPDDPAPALHLVDLAVEGGLDAVTFTSQPAVRNLFRIAGDAPGDRAEALRHALNGPVLPVCVGPVCARAVEEEGVTTSVWPEPNRLPPMVRLTAELLGPASRLA